MRLGLPVSLVLHGALLAWALVTIHSIPPLKLPEPEPVEVSIVTPDALVRLRQGDREAKQREAEAKESPLKEPPKKETPKRIVPPTPPPPAAAEPPPPPPEAKAEPPPKPPEPPKPDPIAEQLAKPEPAPDPGPTPEEKLALEQKLEAERKAEEQRKQAELKKKQDEELRKKQLAAEAARKKKAEEEKKRREAEAKKKQFDSQRMAELLNKLPDDRAPPAGAPTPPLTPTRARGPVAGAPEGRDSQLTANQQSMLGMLINKTYSSQWDISCGSDGVDQIVVKVAVSIKPDGHLAQPPRVMNQIAGELFRLMADAALRAVQKADPVAFPPDLYKGGWDSFVINFDARQRCRQG